MMKKRKYIMGMVIAAATFAMAACNDDGDVEQKEEANEQSNMDHADMEHSGSPETPEGLKNAENPKYEVGSTALIKEGHMEGMEGAEATIVGAYDTNVYAVSYTPEGGGAPVENHKWIIQEEISDAGDELLEPGTEIIIDAEHMKGMEGAEAVIDHGERTTVYMLDFTADGQKVENHKWVTESELSPTR